MTLVTPGAVIPVHCARTFERQFLAELPEWTLGDPPTQVVVPSESLRWHWVGVLARSRRALLGVEVLTHPQWIRGLLREAGLPCELRPAWVEHRAQALAAKEPVLMRALGRYDDGLTLASQAVLELIEAGFEASMAEGILEAAQAWPRQSRLGVGGLVAPRVAALIRVAKKVAQEAAVAGGVMLPMAITKAMEIMKRPGAVSARPVFFLGYADATGRVADLIDAARTHMGARVALDFPPSPTNPRQREGGVAFAEDFHSRFSGVLSAPVVGDSPPQVSWLQAEDPWDEARHVAGRIAALLASGMEPERIGVVVRQSSSWAGPVRRAFNAAAIPYSGVGAEGLGGAVERRAEAALAVLSEGVRVSASVWAVASGQERYALDFLAFDTLGARRLDALVKQLSRVPSQLKLGAITRLEESEGRVRSRTAGLSPKAVEAIRGRASFLVDLMEQWPQNAEPSAHWSRISKALTQGMGFDKDSALRTAVPKLARQFGGVDVLSRDEAIRLFVVTAKSATRSRIGGAGGGVAVLDAIEARGRTFDHLFVMGMNRKSFPRPVVEDPLLPDAARRALRSVLQDLRLKKLGGLEERFLFAQLLASAPAVTLTCARLDVGGSHAHPSAFLVELQLAGVVGEPLAEAPVLERPWAVAVRQALSGADHARVFATAGATSPLVALTAHRLDGRKEQAPFLGEIGPQVGPIDPRSGAQFVTLYESVAGCPWRTFLTRFLGIDKRPDPHGPMAAIGNQLIGSVVHDVIERSVEATLAGRSVDNVSDAVPMVWPSEATLSAWCEEAATACLLRDGVAWPGLARAVVGRCIAAIRLLRELDEQQGVSGVWGSEREFSVELPDGPTIRFRVDRLDRVGEAPQLVDFKLGKPKTVAKTEGTRRKDVLKAVRAGGLLQGALYARVYPESTGKYIYLNPSADYPERVLELASDDDELQGNVATAVAEIEQVMRHGAMFPRLENLKGKGLPACDYCAVREACVLDDSTMRRQLVDAVKSPPETPAEQARRALWMGGADDE